MKYTAETYNNLIKQSYCFSQKEYEKDKTFSMLKTLYERNYLNGSGEDKIPKIIHQIWLGGTLPDRYKKFTESWKSLHPSWIYKMWTEREVRHLKLTNETFFYQATNYGQKSDILRYELLNKFGGIYVDTDFECLKPFDEFLYLDFFTSSGYAAKFELYPALIGSVPGYPVIQRCINEMKDIDAITYTGMFNTTGPYYFAQKFLKDVTEDSEGVVVFPMGFFYPWPNNIRRQNEPYKYIKSYSYAIHHWDVSWTRAKSHIAR